MKEAIEYLIVGTLILIVTSFIITQNLIIPSKATTQASQERLIDQTERILDTILTSPGNPTNWGDTYIISNNTNIINISYINSTSFGLADPNAPIYTLSPTKLSYLKYLQDNNVINSQNIAKIVGINKPFFLRIIPMLNINITNKNIGNKLIFVINIRTHNNEPAFNANVTGTLIYISGTGSNANINYITNKTTASLNGTATLTFNSVSSSYVLVVNVEWGLFRNIATYYNVISQNIVNGYLLGDTLLLSFSENEANQGARQVLQNVIIDLDQQIIIFQWDTTQGKNNNVINKGAKYYLPINLTQALLTIENESIVFIAGGIKYNGEWYTFVVFRAPILPNNSLLLTLSLGNINNVSNAYTAQRLVSINGMTYLVQFTLGEL